MNARQCTDPVDHKLIDVKRDTLKKTHVCTNRTLSWSLQLAACEAYIAVAWLLLSSRLLLLLGLSHDVLRCMYDGATCMGLYHHNKDQSVSSSLLSVSAA
jgi:hypothetical protein